MVDQFPLGEEAAEWLCGATLKSMATPALPPEVIQKGKIASSDFQAAPTWPQPPPFFGALAELEAMKKSWALRIGQAIVAPAKMLKKLFHRPHLS